MGKFLCDLKHKSELLLRGVGRCQGKGLLGKGSQMGRMTRRDEAEKREIIRLVEHPNLPVNVHWNNWTYLATPSPTSNKGTNALVWF